MKISIELDFRQKAAQAFYEFLQTLSFVKNIKLESEPNSITKKAIKDGEEGKTTKVEIKDINNIADSILN